MSSPLGGLVIDSAVEFDSTAGALARMPRRFETRSSLPRGCCFLLSSRNVVRENIDSPARERGKALLIPSASYSGHSRRFGEGNPSFSPRGSASCVSDATTSVASQMRHVPFGGFTAKVSPHLGQMYRMVSAHDTVLKRK